MYFNTSANELKVYNGGAWQAGVTATGNFAVTTGNTFTGNNIFTAHTTHNDSVEARFGTDNDMQISHNGSNAYIVNKVGELNIYSTTGEAGAVLVPNGTSKLYFDGSKKFETTAGGTIITGTLDTTGTITGGGHIKTGTDTGKFFAGASNDLQLYHNGTDSWIYNTTGELNIRQANGGNINLQPYGGENAIIAKPNGSVELFYDATKEFETKSGGVKLNGHSECAVNALGNVNSNPTFDFSIANYITMTLTGNVTVQNPTTESVGQSGSIVITQDGTGSRTCAWSNQFKWTGGAAPTLSTAANAVDRIDYVVVAADTIHCVASLAVA